MAYADDQILHACSPKEMQKRLDRLLVGFGYLGLELNALSDLHFPPEIRRGELSSVDTDV